MVGVAAGGDWSGPTWLLQNGGLGRFWPLAKAEKKQKESKRAN